MTKQEPIETRHLKAHKRESGIEVFDLLHLTLLTIYPDGRWEGPYDLISELNIHEYRSIAGYYVPPYAPASFVPLVWSDYDEGTVKLLKVPVD